MTIGMMSASQASSRTSPAVIDPAEFQVRGADPVPQVLVVHREGDVRAFPTVGRGVPDVQVPGEDFLERLAAPDRRVPPVRHPVLVGLGVRESFDGLAEQFDADVVQLAFEPGHPGVGVAGADGQFDPVGRVLVGFPVQVQ